MKTFHRFVLFGLLAVFAAFFLLPFLIVLRISFAEMDGARISDLFTYTEGELFMKLKLQNFATIFQDDLYLATYAQSLLYAGITTLVCLFIGYPFAYFMARAKPTVQPVLLMLVMLPFWTSFLLRVYAWKGILADQGVLNNLLMSLGLIQPVVQRIGYVVRLLVAVRNYPPISARLGFHAQHRINRWPD